MIIAFIIMMEMDILKLPGLYARQRSRYLSRDSSRALSVMSAGTVKIGTMTAVGSSKLIDMRLGI